MVNKTIHYFVPLVLQKIGSYIFFIFYKIFLRLEIVGREKFKNLKGPVILSANHTSELDVTALPLVLPFFSPLQPVYFVMQPKRRMQNFGWRNYLYGSGFLTLLGGCDIHSGYRNYAISLHKHTKLLRQGRTVCIFPEGKRTHDGSFSPAHGGLGYLAYASRATIVPIAIDTFYNLSWREFLTRKRKVTLKVGDPISPSNIMQLDRAPAVEDFKHAAQSLLDKSREMMG